MVFKLGDGASVHFWDDVWYGKSLLKLIYSELYWFVCSSDASVADVRCLWDIIM